MSATGAEADLTAEVAELRLQLRRTYRPAHIRPALADIVARAQARGDRRALAGAQLELAAVARYQFDPDGARRWAGAALAGFEALEDAAGCAVAHLELAKIDLDCGADPEVELGRAASAVIDTTGELEARLDYVRSRAALRHGRFAEAEGLLKAAVARLEGHGGDGAYFYARYLAQLGLVARLRGAAMAEVYLLEALAHAQNGGFARVEATCLLDLGQIALKRKHLDAAQNHLGAAAEGFAAIEDPLGEAHARSALGSTSRLRGALAEAIALLTKALDTYGKCRHRATAKALAHRRRAQCYIDCLHQDRAAGRPLARADLAQARADITAAIEQFHARGSLDGEAEALAIRARLAYLTDGPAVALEPAMAAVELLGEVRGQFRRGLEQLQFGRLHSWVFGFAMLCAAESGDVEQALRVAAIVQADTLGGVARQALSAEGGELGELLEELRDHEQGLRPSGSDVVRVGPPLEELRRRRDELTEYLNARLASALTPSLERSRLGPGQRRVCIQLFEKSHSAQPREDDNTLYVLSDGPAEADKALATVKLTERQRAELEALAGGDLGLLGDGRRMRWESWGQLLIPEEMGALRAALVAGQVEVLEIEPARDLVRFPFGALLIDGQRLDELTAVLLSPSDLPSFPWLWDGHDDPQARPPWPRRHPALGSGLPAGGRPQPATVDDSFQALVAGLTDIGSFSRQELMEMATGQHTLKQIFAGDEAVASHFRMLCERYQEEGKTLLHAVQAAKAHHRRRCGRTCPPTHVAAFVVAGRLEDTPTPKDVP